MKTRWMVLTVFFSAATLGLSEPLFTSDVTSGPCPWTHTRFPEAANNFHFAVVADRNGGGRPGIFEDAVKKLNLLQPTLVMSVGDFIPGYTGNTQLLQKQWAEFSKILKGLEPPFFLVPGNHDYGVAGEDLPAIEAREKFWKTLWGPAYYWFIYRDTLFLCLNSTGAPNHRWGLGDPQLAWARDVLAQHPKVRWTFVFMHCPLWVKDTEESGNGTGTRFPELEKSLQGRKYTIFAGHWHEYVRYDRYGMKYFVLSVTGGGSDLSGPAWGEFDHIVWVSMTDSGPRFTNLALDGILADDICNETTRKFKNSYKFATKKSPGQPGELDVTFSLKNPFRAPLEVTATWKHSTGWSFEPNQISDTILPGGVYSAVFHANFNGKRLSAVPLLSCQFTDPTGFKGSRDFPLSADDLGLLWPKTVVTVLPTDHTPKIDGKLEDPVWRRPPTVGCFMRPDAAGPANPKTQTWITYDNKNLYVAWRCTEGDMTRLVANTTQRDGDVFSDDSLELFIDPKLDYENYYQFAVNPLGTFWDAGPKTTIAFNSQARVATSRDRDGWTVELSLPWSDLKTAPPQPGSRMGFELVRTWPRAQNPLEILSQFPPLGQPSNHHPKLFGEIIFGK